MLPQKSYTHQLPPSHLASLVRANWLARCREPMKYLNLVNLPMRHERITTKVLRYIVEWAKSLPFFVDLCQNDKQSLLESCWLELFLLVVVQYQLLPDLAKLLMLLKGRNVDKTVRLIEAEVNQCKALNCDDVEMECLKAIVLFNAGMFPAYNNPTRFNTWHSSLYKFSDKLLDLGTSGGKP